ncbi:MAG TPA: hypothetical protein PK089_06700 [Methanoregulaceae archaeon]|nr:hypothetical protein [Methanoregulaceae archaeon]HOV67183.1 hypothetical protein [Methanoregulaceae archaeon]
MGLRDLLDAVLGTTRLPEADSDRLFAISTAVVTMQTSLDLEPSGSAGLCFKPIESSGSAAVRAEIEDLLNITARETSSAFRIVTDAYHFNWVILEDPDFEDLVSGIHIVSQTLIERGLGAYLLCAVFRFGRDRRVYWIYNFKQGRYYPFVPLSDSTRDAAFEFRLRSLLERELPIENEVERWYPLWGIPL